jgi:hypothetical protein
MTCFYIDSYYEINFANFWVSDTICIYENNPFKQFDSLTKTEDQSLLRELNIDTSNRRV